MKEPPVNYIPMLLFQAAREGNAETVLKLLQRYDGESIDPETFKWAVTSFSIPMMRALLRRYPHMVNHQYHFLGTPLIIACLGKAPLEFLGFLLEAGADPNLVPAAINYTAMQIAATIYPSHVQCIETMNLLRAFGGTLDSDVLAWAATCGRVVVMQYLLSLGVPHERDPIRMQRFIPQHQLALHAAAHEGHTWVVFELLAASVDANCKNGWNLTAMEMVQEKARKGHDTGQIRFFLGIWQERSWCHYLVSGLI